MSTRSPWPFAIVGLLGMNVTIVGITVFYAVSDRSMAIEPNYYQKALAWDRSQIQSARNVQLGWTLDLECERAGAGRSELRVDLHDHAGVAINEARVEVLGFHNARAADRYSMTLAPLGGGRYSGVVPADREGLWHFVVTASRGSETFTEVIERTMGAGKVEGTP